MIIIIIGACIAGIIAGMLSPILPYTYSKYVAIAIIAALDTVIGAISAILQGKFNMTTFVSGFFVNSIIAILLTMFGESVDVDIFLAAIVVFIFRIFNNLGTIRRIAVEEIISKRQSKQ